DRLRAEGHRTMPFSGDVRSAPVPGCVDGWLALHERCGRLPLAAVLAPAIEVAEEGFEPAPLLVAALGLLEGVGPEDLLAGRGGGTIRRPGVAGALRSIMAEGRDG